MTDVDLALRPEGWAPKPGSRVVITPRPHAPADESPPPSGVWVVIDRAPEPRSWWLMPHDGEAKVWSVVAMAGRPKEQWPAGWPGVSVVSTRLFPAALLQAVLPGC